MRERFVRWYREGAYSVDGLFDIGGTTADALSTGRGRPGEHFAAQLDGVYAYSKGSIRIPYGKVDAGLISRIAAWCLREAGFP
ncbi:hypothetical protein [Tractidigestivibacter montrealensis]|uniref:Uncharacterized protein n=1 Tax=Tractidigestivibacter montrealensis TaxID=2972466 RepID=A0ABT1Z5D1_9ACTN|nr:hypothetical protein [Tractidigestivibacter montrealensis]MCR9035418.1 hypothetical protein [Tractidigestivibacter montrealensis]